MAVCLPLSHVFQLIDYRQRQTNEVPSTPPHHFLVSSFIQSTPNFQRYHGLYLKQLLTFSVNKIPPAALLTKKAENNPLQCIWSSNEVSFLVWHLKCYVSRLCTAQSTETESLHLMGNSPSLQMKLLPGAALDLAGCPALCVYLLESGEARCEGQV